jgi:CheY-like chemotaxis protein
MDDYVLIVDDDQDARQILSTIVKSLDVDAEAASDGLEALQLARKRIPKLILLDLMMPNMDGYTMLSRIRGNPRTRYIPVIVVTACSVDQLLMLKLPGVKDVVQKGDLTNLKTLVEETLGSIIPPSGGTGDWKPSTS